MVSAAISSTGALVVSLCTGAVFSLGLTKDALLPSLRPELAIRPKALDYDAVHWVEMNLREFEVGRDGTRRVTRIVVGSGGRGFFYEVSDR